MWAMMPIFLQRVNGTVLGTVFLYDFLGLEGDVAKLRLYMNFICFCRDVACNVSACSLPPVMRKRLIGFRHAVHIFFLLDRGSAAIGGVEQFVA